MINTSKYALITVVILLSIYGFLLSINTTLSTTIRRKLLFIREVDDLDDKCGVNVPVKILNITQESMKAIAITINSSGKTKSRLCNLIASLETQSGKNW